MPTNLIRPTGPMRSSTHGPISFEANLQKMLSFDELLAKLGGDRIYIGLALREELERASDHGHRKRLRTAEMADSESGDRGSAEPPNSRSRKKRRITVERETEDRVAARRGETHELRARRTSGSKDDKSKLGNRGLEGETLAAPSQGVYPPFSLRPTIGATLGPTEFQDQAWARTEGSEHISEGTEDVHAEESKEERRSRLIVQEGGKWKCRHRQCGKAFSDRNTARRHSDTVHGRECDKCTCPLCPNTYSRRSGLARHMKKKHQGGA